MKIDIKEIQKLKIEKNELLFIEVDFSKITRQEMNQIVELLAKYDIRVVIYPFRGIKNLKVIKKEPSKSSFEDTFLSFRFH